MNEGKRSEMIVGGRSQVILVLAKDAGENVVSKNGDSWCPVEQNVTVSFVEKLFLFSKQLIV